MISFLKIPIFCAFFFCINLLTAHSISNPFLDSNVAKNAEPPKFIPLKIDKQFLYNVQKSAYESSAKTGNLATFVVPGEIDKLYLSNKTQIAVKLINKDIFRGKLICVSQSGVYLYSNEENGLVYCPYETIEWIRRGRSYGNWLWKSAIAYSAMWIYIFGEQNPYAVTQGILSGGTTAVTIGQLLAAPIYGIRLKLDGVKTAINSDRSKGASYYEMVRKDIQHYSNTVDFEGYPGFVEK